MVALGWGLAQVEPQRDAPPAFSDWGVWVGAGRWEAVEAPLGCLDVSRIPGKSKGEPCLVKEVPWGKGRWQRRCWGIYESIVRPSSTLSLADYIAGVGGGGGSGWEGGGEWIPFLSPEPLRFTNLECFLLLREHFQSISLLGSHDISGK